MAKILTTSGDTEVSLYLTERAKDYIIQGNMNSVIFDKVSLGDSDINYQNIVNLPADGDVLDALGNTNGVIGTVRTNTDIKSKLYTEEFGTETLADSLFSGSASLGFQKYTRLTGKLEITGSTFSYTKVKRDYNLNNNNHYYKSLNLPITATEKLQFDSLYANKGIQLLNQDEIILVNIDKEIYLENIDGRDITIDLTFAGSTYSFITKFFNVSTSGADSQTLRSDPNSFSENFGISRGDGFETNVAYLFSDDLIPPISGGSWSDYTEAKYEDPRETAGTISGGVYIDKCVGIAYLDKGVIAITHPTFVSNFDYSTALNKLDDTPYDDSITVDNFEDIYLPTQNLKFRTLERLYLQNFNYIISETTFNRTSNSTFSVSTNSNLYITEIGLYNASNELMAYGKFSQPLEKVPNITALPITLQICL